MCFTIKVHCLPTSQTLWLQRPNFSDGCALIIGETFHKDKAFRHDEKSVHTSKDIQLTSALAEEASQAYLHARRGSGAPLRAHLDRLPNPNPRAPASRRPGATALRRSAPLLVLNPSLRRRRRCGRARPMRHGGGGVPALARSWGWRAAPVLPRRQRWLVAAVADLLQRRRIGSGSAVLGLLWSRRGRRATVARWCA
jgi:hypothetical protein